MPMATAPSPNDLTRQQLDELDALLQRMLSLPLNPPDAVTPGPHAPGSPAPRAVTDPGSPNPIPAPPTAAGGRRRPAPVALAGGHPDPSGGRPARAVRTAGPVLPVRVRQEPARAGRARPAPLHRRPPRPGAGLGGAAGPGPLAPV